MGEIKKRGDIYWIRYNRNGRRHEESARTKDHKTARDLLRDREGAIAKGIPISAKIGRLKFEDASADLITDYTINKRKSTAHVQRFVDQLTKYFGGRRMAELTSSDCRQYIERRQKAKAANATINRELAALKRMFTLAIQAGKLVVRPHIPMLREDNARQGFFEHTQYRAMLGHLPAALRPILTFAYYTGWRRGEVLGLDWQRVDRHACIVRLEVGTTKNRDGREFHYGALVELRAVIDALWAAHEALAKTGTICPWVFQRFQGKPIKMFGKAWANAAKAAGCPGRILHDCRRTAVRNLERAGVPRSVGKRITGHKTDAVYERYAIVSSSDMADAAAKLQAACGTKVGQLEGFGGSGKK